MRGVRKGEWNHCEGFLGAPGTGKSVKAVSRMLELRAETPCYLIAHDLEYALPEKLPDGRRTGVVRLDTVDAARARLAKDPSGILAIAADDATEVVRFAHEVAERSLASAKGGPAPPVVVLVDEVTNCKEMGANWLGPTLQRAVVARRHRHTALFFTAQSPALVHRQLLMQSTALFVFRCKSERDVEKLERDAGFQVNSHEAVTKLRNYKYIAHTQQGTIET